MSDRKKHKKDRTTDPAETVSAAERSVADEKLKKKKGSETGAKNSPNEALVPVIVPAEEPQKEAPEEPQQRKKEERRTPAKNLPVSSNGNQVSASTVPVYIPERERRSMWSRLLALLLIAAVVFASVAIFLFRPTSYTEKTNSIRYLYNAEKNATFVVVNGRLRGTKEGYTGSLQNQIASADGGVSVALIDDRLYSVKGRKVVEMAFGVTDFALSADGDAVAWRNTQHELFYAAVGDPEDAKRVNTAVTSDRYCLSPNGQELFYTYVENDDILRINVLSNSGNKPNMPENQNLYPVAIANNCNYLYYTDADGALYVFSREEQTKTKCGVAPTDMVFNRDLSQLIFRNGEEGKIETRMYVDGVRFLITDLAADVLALSANRRVSVCRTLLDGSQYMTKTLLNNYYVRTVGTAYQLVYLTRKDGQGKLELVSHVDNAEQVTVTDKYVYFINTSEGTNARTNLYYAESGKLQSSLFYNDVKSYCTNVDGSRLLYVTSEGLFSGRVNGDHDWLSDYVVDGSLCVTTDDVFYFYYEPGVLGVSDNGEEPRRLAESVDDCLTDGDTVYYITDAADDGLGMVHANFRNSRKSDKLADGIQNIK